MDRARGKPSLFSTEKPWIWLIPMGLMLLVFYIYPLVDVIRLSFTNASLIGEAYEYGFDSYKRIFTDPRLMYTLRITTIFGVTNIFGQLIFGLIIALAVHHSQSWLLKGTTLVRAVVLAAWIIPGVLTGILWRMLLTNANYGLVNYFIKVLGFSSVPFLYHPNYALFSVIIANIWRGVAFSMILQYAGLQRIPKEFYEAALVDGATGIQQFRYITLPQLSPTIFINTVLITIYTFNTFDIIMSLTGGGPARRTEVLTLSAYTQVFKYLNLGRGAALAVLLLIVNLAMTLLYYRVISMEEEIE